MQPLDGSARHPVTDFKSEQIWSFDLSPDGKNLAVMRGHYDSDVVLLQETTPSRLRSLGSSLSGKTPTPTSPS
jgi:hypothetical protein